MFDFDSMLIDRLSCVYIWSTGILGSFSLRYDVFYIYMIYPQVFRPISPLSIRNDAEEDLEENLDSSKSLVMSSCELVRAKEKSSIYPPIRSRDLIEADDIY